MQTYFDGTLDGKENTITGVKITQTDVDGIGIVGVLGENGTIKNLNTYEGTVIGKYLVGGIVGLNYGKIENCSNNLKITAKNNCGGISGYQIAGTITKCSNRGEVTTNNYQAGGIVGYQVAGTIENCSNNGIITADKTNAGGIAGTKENGTITGCSNSGEIIAKKNQAGGIAGVLVAGTIENCSNNGTITANTQMAGGIAGALVAGTIKNCANASSIIAKAETSRGIAGGIIGFQAGGETYNVYNSGNVTTANFSDSTVDAVGGIVGYQKAGTISKAYNKGELTGGEATGGIIGQKNLAAEINETYYYTSQDIKGIGSETDTNTEVTAVEDVQGKTEKTSKNIESLQSFLTATMP